MWFSIKPVTSSLYVISPCYIFMPPCMLYLHAIVQATVHATIYIISLCHHLYYCPCHMFIPPSMSYVHATIYTMSSYYIFMLLSLCHVFMPSSMPLSMSYLHATIYVIFSYHCPNHRLCHRPYHISMPLSLCYSSMPYWFGLLLKADVMGINWKPYTLHFSVTYQSI